MQEKYTVGIWADRFLSSADRKRAQLPEYLVRPSAPAALSGSTVRSRLGLIPVNPARAFHSPTQRKAKVTVLGGARRSRIIWIQQKRWGYLPIFTLTVGLRQRGRWAHCQTASCVLKSVAL